MPERKNKKNDNSQKKGLARLGKMGKIFLLTGIVFIQAFAAYAVINHFYPDLVSLTAKLGSNESAFYKLNDIVINPADSNGQRYLVFSLAIKLKNKDALNILESKKAEAKDRINLLMSHYTSAELGSLKKRAIIKKRLGTTINHVIGKKSVRNLFFTRYIMQ